VAELTGAEPKVTRIAEGVFRVEHDGGIDLVYVAGPPSRPWAFCKGRVFHGVDDAPRATAGHAGGIDAAQSIAAPMPATVLHVLVRPGDAVKKGDTLIVLEAMKMELPLRAPGEGTVVAVHCRDGEMVQADAVLLDLK
jgi:biotin carboxyl carrier protein